MEISLEKRLTIILWVHMIRIAVQIKVISLLYLYEAYILPFLLQNWCNSILRVLNILMHGPICVYVDILTWNMNLSFILITNKSWKMQKKVLSLYITCTCIQPKIGILHIIKIYRMPIFCGSVLRGGEVWQTIIVAQVDHVDLSIKIKCLLKPLCVSQTTDFIDWAI